jgi:hypothetical protein
MKTYSILFIIGCAGLACGLAYNVIGSRIDAYGHVEEPFFLIPVGLLLSLAGFGGMALVGIWRAARLLLKRGQEAGRIDE